jgi:hypothetical protein
MLCISPASSVPVSNKIKKAGLTAPSPFYRCNSLAVSIRIQPISDPMVNKSKSSRLSLSRQAPTKLWRNVSRFPDMVLSLSGKQ